MSNFTHLHLHTEYSLLDGANQIKRLAQKLKSLGMDSVAITDHGNMFGALDFYITMLQEGIKPIIGIETYIHNNDDLGYKDKLRFHLCLFAKDYEGYKNLMFLSSQAYLSGFYKNPRINKKILKEHSSGLICSSACLQGEVNYHLNTMDSRGGDRKGYDYAKQVALGYRDIFGDDFYLEIMRHGIKEQQYIDEQILKISKETGIKVIATNDTHYTTKKDAFNQEVIMCISTGRLLKDTNRLKHSVEEFYVKSSEDMNRLFADIPDVLENTQEIVNKCNLVIDLKNTELKDPHGNVIIKNIPPTAPTFKFTKEYATNEGLNIEDDESYFRYKCEEGLKERLQHIEEKDHQIYKDRLSYEMDIISKMKFPGYMLIVWDFVREAKKQRIPVGPGRGSAAGSLVAFCLYITNIDPIKHNLLFERFLNPERVTMPDIDMDFCQERRGDIINYVSNKYGKNNVAQVVTFNSMSAKSVVRDVTRVFDIDYKTADNFAKLIPNKLKIRLQTGEKENKDKMGAFELEPKIGEIVASSDEWRDIWDTSLALENQKRNVGTHAAAIVIDSEEELWNKIPLCVIKDKVATQYSMDYLEKVNLIKFDFLGLKTLDVIQKTLDLIGENIDFNTIDLNDEKVYQTIQSGDTIGMFQIESSGMRALNRRLKTSCFDDLVAVLALFRPGPLEAVGPEFVDRKHGIKKIEYIFDELEPILKSTYGTIVYQEQVMQIVQVIGGFSLGKADLVRRAMGKKKVEEMIRLKEEFASGAAKQGFDKKKAEELWELILKFAGYGFNKSHSAAYAMITFQTAYLKTYYKHEFMAALLSSENNNVDKINQYIQECRNMGIEVLPPHINTAKEDFSVATIDGEKKIIFGFSAIKGIGENPIKEILKARGDKRFNHINEFLSAIDSKIINKKVIESLAKSGALNDLGFSVKSIINNLDLITDIIRGNSKALEMMNAQDSLFRDIETSYAEVEINIKDEQEYDFATLLDFEYEMLGIFMSGNPLDDFSDRIDRIKGVVFSNQIQSLVDNSKALLVGIVKDINKRTSKKGNIFAEVLIVDKVGNTSLQVFEKNLAEIESSPKDVPICLKCHASMRDEIISLRLEKVISLDSANKENVVPIFNDENTQDYGYADEHINIIDYVINIPCNATYAMLKKIQELALENVGNERLVLSVEDKDTTYKMYSAYKISDNFKEKFKALEIA